MAMTPHRHLPRGLAVNMLQQLASQTPTWVWLLPAILVTRGIAAMKPGGSVTGKYCRHLASWRLDAAGNGLEAAG
jgi:hypothetical protein